MNCPECDSQMYTDICACGYKTPKPGQKFQANKNYIPPPAGNVDQSKVEYEIKKMRSTQVKYRSVLSRGQDYGTYLLRLAKSKMPKRDFDLLQMQKNGWTQQDETSFRDACCNLKIRLPD